MKRLYGVVAFMLGIATSAAFGQVPVQVIEEIRFNSNNTEDGLQRITFGFGAQYTDSVDFDMGEYILPPFFPPDGFFVFLSVPDNRGAEDFAVKDIRGIPDSVKSGAVNNFALSYSMLLKRGIGQNITISFPRTLVSGIDSVNVLSPQAGSNFSHTFTREGGQVTINPFITRLIMTVYYNYDRAASAPVENRERSGLALAPNQVRPGQMMSLVGEVPAGARLVVSDLYGTSVWQMNLGEARQGMQLAVPALPTGMYVARLLGADGSMVHQERFTVAR